MKKPITYNEESLILGASIGISIFQEHGEDSDTLINNADLAMYEVKKMVVMTLQYIHLKWNIKQLIN